MRILVLNPFELTAATTIRMEQLSRIIALEHRVLFVSYGDKAGRAEKENIEYIVFKKRFPSPFFHFHQMWLKLLVCLRERYDLIYVSKPLPWALLPALAAKLLRGKKLLLDWDEHELAIISRLSRNPLYLGIFGAIEKCGVKMADALVVVSPYLRKLALKWGYAKENIALVQNGVDPALFKVRLGPEALRKEYGLRGRIVMFLGSLRPQFDIDLVLRAMPLVIKEVREARLVIVGGGSERKNLERLADSLKISESVVFIGPQPHELVPSFVHAAEIVVAPNRNNNMNLSRSPVKIAEYMAIGTPVVANAVGLAADMLKGGAGELVYSESPAEMARKIVGLLKDRKRGERLASAARERAIRLYTWERLGAVLTGFIKKRFGYLGPARLR
jgi:glycosyltransferase involved in cell wall biosynthesis